MIICVVHYSADATSNIRAICQGNNDCVVPVSRTALGLDPCGLGVYKYIVVKFTCEGMSECLIEKDK